MMCQRMGLPPTSTSGFGRYSVSSRSLVPCPPHRITMVIATPRTNRTALTPLLQQGSCMALSYPRTGNPGLSPSAHGAAPAGRTVVWLSFTVSPLYRSKQHTEGCCEGSPWQLAGQDPAISVVARPRLFADTLRGAVRQRPMTTFLRRGVPQPRRVPEPGYRP